MRSDLIKIVTITSIVISVFIQFAKASEDTRVTSFVRFNANDIKNKLLFNRSGDIWAFDLRTKSEMQLTHTKNITNYCVSSDAKKIAYFKNIKKLFVYDVETGIEEFLAEATTDASQPSFSPSADRIAFVGLTKSKVKVRFNYYSNPTEQFIRHIWIVDVKTKNVVDVTKDIPFQHSQVKWSPDGMWLTFASFRVGILDKLIPSTDTNWKVYVMALNTRNNKTLEVGDGMSSVWLNANELIFSEGVAANVLKSYDVKARTLRHFSIFRAGFSPSQFVLGGSADEIIYYEAADGPDEEIIRSLNTRTNQVEDLIQNASSPFYVK